MNEISIIGFGITITISIIGWVIAIIQALRNRNLQKEIETLQNAEPPESYSTDTITDWLNSIKEAPTPQAIKLLVERIVVAQNGKKIDLRVESTLRSIQKMVAGEGLEPTTSGL